MQVSPIDPLSLNMLILHVAEDYYPRAAGVPEVVAQISRRLASWGHEVHVATGTPPGSLAEELRDGVHIHRFKVEGGGTVTPHGDIRGYLDFVRSRPWDVIAIHCASAWTTDVLLAHVTEFSSAVIMVSHGLQTLDETAHDPYWSWLAASLRAVDASTTLSPLLQEMPFCAKYNLPRPFVIPNGVDTSEWSTPSVEIRQRWHVGDAPWIVNVSNHTPVKAHATFFSAVDRVSMALPTVRGTIVGNSHRVHKWRLGRLGVKGGCWYGCHLRARQDTHVDLRSMVARPDVVSAIKEADVLVLTSPRTREASPIIILEAMAAGTPWLSFGGGCVREHVGGLVVTDLTEMVEKLQMLLGDQQLRHSLGKAGQKRTAEKHSWDTIARQYERLYRDVVAGRAAAVTQNG